MAAGKRLVHTLLPAHLAVLQYLDQTIDQDNLEFVSENRIQNNLRFAEDSSLAPVDPKLGRRRGEKRPIGEALHDLTYRLNEKDDPFVLVHNSGKHYAISENGRRLARRCSIALRSNPYGEKVPTVIETAKGKPPSLTSVESTAPIRGDEDDDDDPVVLPSRKEIEGDGPPITVAGDEPDVLPAIASTDEINNPRVRGQQTKPPVKKPQAKHTKATVPGGE